MPSRSHFPAGGPGRPRQHTNLYEKWPLESISQQVAQRSPPSVQIYTKSGLWRPFPNKRPREVPPACKSIRKVASGSHFPTSGPGKPRQRTNLDFSRAQIHSQIIKKISSNRPLFFNLKGGVLPGSLFLECLEEFALPCTGNPPRLRDPRFLSLTMAIQGASISAEASGPSFFIALNIGLQTLGHELPSSCRPRGGGGRGTPANGCAQLDLQQLDASDAARHKA